MMFEGRAGRRSSRSHRLALGMHPLTFAVTPATSFIDWPALSETPKSNRIRWPPPFLSATSLTVIIAATLPAAREINQNDCFPKLMNAKGAGGWGWGEVQAAGGVGRWRGRICHASSLSSTHERQGRAQAEPRAGVQQPRSRREGGEEKEGGATSEGAVSYLWSRDPADLRPLVPLWGFCGRVTGFTVSGMRTRVQERGSR